MKRSKFTEERIVRILKESNAGGTVKDLCRRHGHFLPVEVEVRRPGGFGPAKARGTRAREQSAREDVRRPLAREPRAEGRGNGASLHPK